VAEAGSTQQKDNVIPRRVTMAMHSNRLRSLKSLVAAWLRVLSDRYELIFDSFPRLDDAVGADDLPVSFILRRDSHGAASGAGRRRSPMPGPIVKGIDRSASVHVAAYRADARSTLRPNAERRSNHRAA
jgi:hypothetical protein